MSMSRELRHFLIATFAINWLLAAAFYLSPFAYGGLAATLMAATYMLVPGAVALVVDRRAGHPLRSSLWLHFKPNWWWLVAWLLAPVLAFMALGAALLLPGVGLDIGMAGFLEQLSTFLSDEELAEAREQLRAFPTAGFVALQLAQGLIAGATINAFFALGEELGWRGLMLRELASRGFWKSAGIIGAVWGIWHAPLILQGHNYPEHPVIGVALMTLWCILLSPLFSWLTLKCRSVVAAAILHGTLNATFAFSFIFLDRLVPLVTGLNGLIGCGVLVVVNGALFIIVRPSLSADDWAQK